MLGHRALNVEDYVTILKRRWWLVVIPAVLFPIFAYFIASYIPARYESQTLVLIERQQVPIDIVHPLVNEDLDNRLASMQEQILSRSSIQPIIEKYGLYANDKMTMEDKVDLMRKSITIKMIRSDIPGTSLPGFHIFFDASDPSTAQQLCREVTSLFIGQNELDRSASVKQTTDYLVSELADAKRALDEQDAKLAEFEGKYFGRLPSDVNNNVNIMGTLDNQRNADTQQLAAMEENRSFWEAELAQQSNTTTADGSSAKSREELEKQLEKLEDQKTALLTQYTADFPDVRAKDREIADLRKQIAQAAEAPAPPSPVTSFPIHDSATVQDLRAKLRGVDLAIQNKHKDVDRIQQQIDNYRARIESSPAVEEEYKQLTRDHQTSQANYDSLQNDVTQAKKSNDLESRQQGERFRLRDDANLPDSPIWPKKGLFLIGGLLAGLATGLLFVALLEYKDTALRSERDIWAFTQLPTLAVIAWSGEIADIKPTGLARLTGRRSKGPKDTFADLTG